MEKSKKGSNPVASGAGTAPQALFAAPKQTTATALPRFLPVGHPALALPPGGGTMILSDKMKKRLARQQAAQLKQNQQDSSSPPAGASAVSTDDIQLQSPTNTAAKGPS